MRAYLRILIALIYLLSATPTPAGFFINPFAFGGGGNDAFTIMLLHCDGTDASTTITDSSVTAATITAVADAQIDTAQSKFGGASCLFDGTGDYLSTNVQIALGSGDWTIDWWARPVNVSGIKYQIDFRPSATNGVYPTVYATGAGVNFFVSSADRITGGSVLAANTWIHMAIVKASGTTSMYANGTITGSTYADSNTYLAGTSPRPHVAANANSAGANPMNGHFDEFRISTTARWTANFTPPAAPYF